jgi:hypothetical protein
VLDARSSGESARLPTMVMRATGREAVELKVRAAGRATARDAVRRKADMLGEFILFYFISFCISWGGVGVEWTVNGAYRVSVWRAVEFGVSRLKTRLKDSKRMLSFCRVGFDCCDANRSTFITGRVAGAS